MKEKINYFSIGRDQRWNGNQSKPLRKMGLGSLVLNNGSTFKTKSKHGVGSSGRSLWAGNMQPTPIRFMTSPRTGCLCQPPQQALRMLAPKRSASEIIGSQNLSRLVAEGYTVTSADLLNETSKALEYAKGAIELALSTSDEPMTREQVLRLGGVLRQSRVTLAKLESEV